MTMAAAASAPRSREAAKASNVGDLGNASVMEADAVAVALKVDIENGLNSQEAARRLAPNGSNQLRAAPWPSAWCRFLSQFQDR